MRLATDLIPPSLDAKQALRLRRFGLAAFGYALVAALVAVVWAFGLMPAETALGSVAAFVAINLVLYAVIRSGFNLRFADPSLTLFQILTAITVMMSVAYHMDDGRNVLLFASFMVLLFGMFHLNAREFTVIILYTLVAYALVINLLMHLRPQAIHDMHVEWMTWVGLAVLLPGFAIIGGQLNTLKRKLRESELRFRSLTELSTDFYWETDTEHRLAQRSWADKKLGTVSVFGQGTPIGKRRWEIPYLSPDEALWMAHRSLLDARRSFRDFVFSRLSADGIERYVSISGDPMFDKSGAFKGYRGVGTDITARKQAEQALRASVQELRLFADNVPAIIVSYDENLHFRFVSKRFAEFFGVTVENTLGKHLREVSGEETYREIEGYFVQVLQGRPVSYQRTHNFPNGKSRYLEIKLLPHIGEQGKVLGCFSVATDITEHKLAEERIQIVAHHDSLTGLPNRLLFNDRLTQAINLAKRDSRQFALLYLDLDRFKHVNDSLGHAAGDELLQAVATRILHLLRESDTVARVGGDEFAVILSNITRREEAEIVARKIIATLATPFQLGSHQQRVNIGTSIGIAFYPANGQDADALVKAADAAMYSAKQVGSSFRFCV